jgi:hypothetical protein
MIKDTSRSEIDFKCECVRYLFIYFWGGRIIILLVSRRGTEDKLRI